jgi:hypothetical protein
MLHQKNEPKHNINNDVIVNLLVLWPTNTALPTNTKVNQSSGMQIGGEERSAAAAHRNKHHHHREGARKRSECSRASPRGDVRRQKRRRKMTNIIEPEEVETNRKEGLL